MDKENNSQIQCPECGDSFSDMRGLTSHARHKHNLNRDQLVMQIREPEKEDEDGTFLKVLGGAGAVLIALITLGRFR